ncbi:MAG: transglutaminase TgpA family protein [Nevskiales bacterium]
MTAQTVHPGTTLRLLAAVAVVIIPHLGHLPIWASLSTLGFGLWRAIAAIRHWRLPARWARVGIMILALVGVYAEYGRINGQHPGTTLLVLLLAVKLTELRTARDHAVLALFGYVVLATLFLFSQELPQIIWLLGGSLAITLSLVDLSRPAGPLPIKASARHSAALMLQGIPLMLILFILFPRIPGPLWGLPADTGQATIGLSDSMSPGSISGLTDTGAVAFRVRFDGTAPQPDQLYWRGPVFWQFDGRSWHNDRSDDLPKAGFEAVDEGDNTLSYQVTLEPHRKYWLFALDMPISLPPKAHFSPSRQVLSRDKVRERQLYKMQSVTQYRLEPQLSEPARQWGLQLPSAGNPRSRELIEQWQAEGAAPAQISQRALRMFSEQAFIYTLQPPLLGRNSIDEFLFGTRRGFCEHYAGAYTFLMRSAGIPARIVTGYQGGEYNQVGGYYIIRQADAHAWVEIWLEGQGWVRVDPTAAVAPERIESGLATAVGDADVLPAVITRRFPLMYQLQMRWDWVNQSWYEWILAYGPELQKSFLGRFGLAEWGRMILVLTLLSTLFLAVLGAAFVVQSRRKPLLDPVQKEWQLFCKKMARQGVPRRPFEGPRDYAQRLVDKLPQHKDHIELIARNYTHLRYGKRPDETGLRLLRRRVRQFKPA